MARPPRRPVAAHGPRRRPAASSDPAPGPRRRRAPAPAVPGPRRRRSAAEARAAILDAAERQLRERGPAALRLQDVAAEVGISHPTLLHHVGSRDELVAAVVERASLALVLELSDALDGDDVEPVALLDRVASAFAARGQARLLAWLILDGYQPLAGPALRDGWDRITRRTHGLRPRTAPREDTQLTVLLAWLALFAEALIGADAADAAGLSPTAARRFRPWLAALLAGHLTR